MGDQGSDFLGFGKILEVSDFENQTNILPDASITSQTLSSGWSTPIGGRVIRDIARVPRYIYIVDIEEIYIYSRYIYIYTYICFFIFIIQKHII